MKRETMIEQNIKPIEEALLNLSAEGVLANYPDLQCLWR